MLRIDGLSGFWTQLAASVRRVLLLDYDGTLAPLRKERDRALPYGGVRRLLREIHDSGETRLVFVTGRAALDLERLLGLGRPVEMWGSHGVERLRADGRLELAALPDKEHADLNSAARCMEASGQGGRIERKHGCVALHWRGLPGRARADLEARARELWAPVASRGLVLAEFDGGIEIRSPATGKGAAVRAVLSEEKDACSAYLGDDMTDEDAFRAMKGRGLAALVAPSPRSSEADAWLKPPCDVTDFLDKWLCVIRRCRKGGAGWTGMRT